MYKLLHEDTLQALWKHPGDINLRYVIKCWKVTVILGYTYLKSNTYYNWEQESGITVEGHGKILRYFEVALSPL